MSFKPFFITAVLAFTGCSKDPRLWKIGNLNGNVITVMGHAGMGNESLLPMDSYASLMACLEAGAGGTEMDVRMSADSVLFLFHDEELGGMPDGSGTARDAKWSYLESCRYAPRFILDGKIIRPGTFLGAAKNLHQFTFSFESKIRLEDPPAYYRLFADRLLSLISDYGLEDNVLIESFNVDYLSYLHNRNPRLKLFLYTDDHRTGIAVHDTLPVFGIIMDLGKVTEQAVKEAHANGLRVSLFNMRTEKENIRAIELSPDYVQTDELENMLDLLE